MRLRSLFPIIALVLTNACISWRPIMETPHLTPAPLPDRVKIERMSGSPLYLRGAQFADDAIVGRLSRWDGGGSGMVALRDVRTIYASHVSAARTALAVIGAALLAGLVYENTRPKCTDCITLF